MSNNYNLGPFLRSDTETDFPRTVRSAKRSRFAATVFVRSKPVNWVKKISTNVYVSYGHNENWFFTYIGSYTLIGSYMSAFMYAPGHHWPNISKTQPLDLDHGLSEGTGAV